MIVSKELLTLMYDLVRKALAEHRAVSYAEVEELGIPYDAIRSLQSHVFVRELKLELRNFNYSVKQSVVRRVHSGESLLSVAREYRLGTYKFALLYLQEVYGNIPLASILHNPERITDGRIRRELLTMIALDTSSSPDVDLLKECIGKEYEELLINLLNSRHMCFETEVELRSKGKPKTPDILFMIPMAVALNSFEQQSSTDTSGNAVVNWIDSKAMFADCQSLEEQIEQFRAYNNRYGRGMVIYWHGFAEDIFSMAPTDMMILFRDSFPEHWLFPTGEPADGRIPEFDKVELL